MPLAVTRTQMAVAVAAAVGTIAISATSPVANAKKDEGAYVAGDFHNHTTCSDGSISMQKLVKKATDKNDTPWGLDWFVQAGHGGNGNRNCTLVEDATLSTPAYPFVEGQGPNTTWANSIGTLALKGDNAQASGNMWRWQSLQEFQYPVIEYLSSLRNVPLFLGLESVVAGHEHSSMSVITGQMPAGFDRQRLPSAPGFTPLGNANALAKWSYCFDRGDTDKSRGGNQNWECSVPHSSTSTDPSIGWDATAQKILPVAPVGTNGHLKTVEALKWMRAFHGSQSYYVPAHLERAGPFNPTGNNGYNIEHLRNFNNAAPRIAFGFETQPGHGASDARGEYTIRRNSINSVRVDSVGGTTFGGTGVYGAQIGGVWDALLGEGRSFWFFASSDWHNRGIFSADDRRSSQDFYPGEYQRNYTLVEADKHDRWERRDRDDRRDGRGRGRDDKHDGRNKHDDRVRLTPQQIVDGLRTGNNFVASGQLIDRLAFIACVGNGARHGRSEKAVEELAINAAMDNTAIDKEGCVNMGEKLEVPRGADVIVSIVVRDPSGTNYSPYSFNNPSLAQVGIRQPLNMPVLDHVDVIRGAVSGFKRPDASDYAGAWPDNWVNVSAAGAVTLKTLADAPDAAKNTSAALLKTFSSHTWDSVKQDRQYKVMTFKLSNVRGSQYLRLRGTNLPAGTPWETDANGNPLPDLFTNAAAVARKTGSGNEFAANFFLKIPCTATGNNVPANSDVVTGGTINGCPNHLPVVNGQKMSAFDVAAWSDLWFYSNPIYVEVDGSTVVAGVR